MLKSTGAGAGSRRAIVGAIVGFLYGSALGFLALLAAGAGHGTNLPILLSSAPLGAFGFFAGLYGAPLLWTTIGALVASSLQGKRRRLTQAFALLHYASGLALVATTSEELAHLQFVLRRWPEMVVVWATVYLTGQVALWRRLMETGPGEKPERMP